MQRSIVRDGLIAALDIGTSKVCCLIARVDSRGAMRIIGRGFHRAKGMKNGAITNLLDVETSIRNAVALAEQSAGESIKSVLVNITSQTISSQTLEAEIQLSPYPIGNSDVNKLLNRALGQFSAEDEAVIHRIPINYSIDGDDNKIDPRGMTGETLGVRLNIITANSSCVRNINSVVERSHLEVAAMVASPYASALSCLVDDEKDIGCTLVDIGAGTTSIAVFINGQLEFADVIPVGGNHITNDIACGLTTTVTHAEKLKNLYGCAFPSPHDEKEILNVPLVGENEETACFQIKKSDLIRIIVPRVEETFELVKKRLDTEGLYNIPSRRVVLTGGSSQLQGIREAASFILDRQVRIGKPYNITNLPEGMDGPAFSTVAGILRYALNSQPQEKNLETEKKTEKFGRIGKWFLQSF